MILHDDVGVLGLDGLRQLTQHGGLSDTCHILQADFLGSGCNHLVGDGSVVVYGMNWGGGDTQRGLRRHSAFLGPLDTRDDIAGIVQTAEDTGDVHTLSMLHLIH